jgi:uncharacterized protein (TIGR00369 family)
MIKGNNCFVCGPENERGLRAQFTIEPERQAAWARLEIPPWSQGWRDVAHGGILATLLDEACVHACRTVGPLPVTAELTVRYRKPVPVGREIVVRGEVVSVRRRVLQARARLQIAGEVHAEAEARVVLLTPEDPEPEPA